MKTRYILTCIAALLAFCACNDTKEEVEINGTQLVLTACQEGSADSKTAVEDGGKQVFWEPGDEIKVFSGSRSGKFTSSAKSLEAVTTFTGHLEGTGPDVEDIWAVYPYSDEASFDGECITTVIPSVQVARPGTFAQGANVAIAHSTTTNLQFYNVGGGIRFSLTEEGVNKVIFEGLGGEVISGTVKVGFEEGLPKVKEISGGSMFITLTPPEGESFTAGEWYYLTAIPRELNNGFKLRFYKDDDTYAKVVSEKAYAMKRRVFASGAQADLNASYGPITLTYPESDDEWDNSCSISESIGYSIGLVLEAAGNDGDETDVIINSLKAIQDVVTVETDESGSTISVMQKDSVWINIIRHHKDSDEMDISYDTIDGSLSKNAIARKVFNHTVLDSKTALLLSPFQSVWNSDLSYKANRLYEAGFGHVRIRADNDADILHFKGDFLSQYDFIFINTHGGLSYSLGKPKGKVKRRQTVFASSTLYDKTAVKKYIKDGTLRKNDIAIVFEEESKKFYLAMTADFLDGSHFNNSVILASACNSMAILSDDDGDSSMAKAFIDRGASLFIGYKTSINRNLAELQTNLVTKFASRGISFQRAVDYWKQSPVLGLFCTSLKNYIAFREHEQSDLDIVDQTLMEYYPTSQLPIHLFEPTPMLNEPLVEDEVVTFSWNSDLSSFDIPIRFVNHNGFSSERYSSTLSYELRHFLVLHGYQTIAYDSGAALTHKAYLGPGQYRWFVHSSIREGSNVIDDFKSDESTIYISEATPKAVDLGLSVKWATFNIGATKPEEYGDYFAWGDISPQDDYRWSKYKWCNGNRQSLTKYNTSSSSGTVDNKTVLDPEDDAAHVNWGECWRMPTYDDWMELQNNCTLTWVDNYDGTGVAGEIVTSNKAGYKDKSIFLPAAGQRYGTGWRDSSSMGYYWSSSLDTDYHPYNAWYMLFDSNGLYKNYDYRYLGFSIRPVFTE